MTQDPDCLFCKIIAGEIPCTKIYEDQQTLAFADINPITDGHTLVIPKAHHENLMEMSPEALAATHATCQKVARAIKQGLGSGGVAVLQLNGRAANQLVMHYHVHLVPRNGPEDGIKTFDWEVRPGDMNRISELAAKIAAAV
jgi:histidine triad (HIT) family protein